MFYPKLTSGILPLLSRCRARALHTFVSSALDPLMSFPEYVSAKRYRDVGKFSQAMSDIQRVQDVLVNSMGAQSVLYKALQVEIASSYLQQGNMAQAESVLQESANYTPDGSIH